MTPVANYDLKIKTRIKLVHIAKHEIGMSDDDYRLLLANWKNKLTRKPCASSTEMDWHQLGELLVAMKACGFKLKQRGAGGRGPGKTTTEAPRPAWKKYESSIKGLKNELCDLARARFGEAWELPLNNFCARFGVKRWQWLDVAHGKEVKAALLRLQKQNNFTAENAEGAEKSNEEELPV
jgi:hypothetical protein